MNSKTIPAKERQDNRHAGAWSWRWAKRCACLVGLLASGWGTETVMAQEDSPKPSEDSTMSAPAESSTNQLEMHWSGVIVEEEEDILIQGQDSKVVTEKTVIILIGPDGERQSGELSEMPAFSLRFDSDHGWAFHAGKLADLPTVKEHLFSELSFYIGVRCQPLDQALQTQLGLEHGLVVEQVFDDSPAANAGIEPFDILISADGTPLEQVDQLTAKVQTAGKQQVSISFSLLRKGQSSELQVQPQRRPALTQGRMFSEMEELSKTLQDMQFELHEDELFFDRLEPGILQPAMDPIRLNEQLEQWKKRWLESDR